jgi:hypothetical protein
MWRRCLVASGLALTFLAMGPEKEALAYDYCGWLVPAHSWCWSPWIDDDNLVTWNRARYPGSGSVGVGIIYYHTFTGSYSCRHYGTNYVSATCYARGIYGGVANTSDNRHTIEGRMNICWGCSSSLMLGDDSGESPDGAPTPATLEQIASTEFQLDAARARLAVVDDADASWFVVPGERTCLFRQLPTGEPESATCSTREHIDEGSAYLVSDSTFDLAPGHVRFAGLAPEGARAVRLQLDPDDPIVEVPVVNGVFVTEMSGAARPDPATVEFVSDETPEPDEVLTEPEAGGCRASASGSGGAAASILLALCALFLRRRNRTSAAR